MTANEIRQRFLKFFEARGHRIAPSDSLIPTEDPTLLFTGSGMNQFKPLFLGQATEFKRQVSCQKCLRTDDLINVGKTAGHHTFFEMLGNFSFGDYFKKEAIEWAWEFLTEDLGLPQKLLWVSVYKEDDESFNIWKNKIGISSGKILKLGEKENFWPSEAPSKGPNGPCGPCSEIFYDQGEGIGCGKSNCNPACDCDRFVELWNLVFTQYDRRDGGNLATLPNKNIDTGMGLERTAAVLQGKQTNFEIDILYPVALEVRKILKVKRDDEKTTPLVNAIVDHARAAVFAISDGVYPSNEERGYVIRKIIRKAVWGAHLLGQEKPFLHKLVPLYAELMGKFYNEIDERKAIVASIIHAEEEKFFSTLSAGEKRLMEVIKQCKKEKKTKISAKDLFRLYDTHGFPVELSEELAKGKKLKVDKKGYEVLLEKQQELSRKKSMFDDEIFLPVKEVSEFVGYRSMESDARVLQLVPAKGRDTTGKGEVRTLKDERGLLVLDKTPFYPEGGGQLTDNGIIKSDKGEFRVEKATKVGGAILHWGQIKGRITKGSKVRASVDKERRAGLMHAHTATHLLQAALRAVLGEHVIQQGSLVDVDRLRFDFTHHKALTQGEIDKIESLVNEQIGANIPVKAEYMTKQKSLKQGAIALFSEKYGEEVRVISVGDLSKELCGGTHMSSTGGINLFLITSEGSIASGIRRIEAVTGRAASGYKRRKKHEADLKEKTQNLNAMIKTQEKEAQRLKVELLLSRIDDIIARALDVRGAKIIAYRQDGIGPKELRKLCDLVRSKVENAIIVLGSVVGKKPIIICSVSKGLLKLNLSASRIANEVAKVAGGSGGGTAEMAQAGGKDPSRLNEALKRVPEIVKKQLKK